ncbi:MAG: toll/interleukin-1 receptor domain-containing protein [Bryobacteraceae bacterium]|jgi:hypothetical protein
MSDIFISYASEDRPRAKTIAEALEDHGWTVWWDRVIPAGRKFAEVIQEEIAKAGCLVVLWSEAAVASDWVIEEATVGRKKGNPGPDPCRAGRTTLGFPAVSSRGSDRLEG